MEMTWLRRSWRAYLFVLPALLLFSVFLIKPMAENIVLSFFRVGLVDRSFVGLGNYIKMFSEPLFWRALKNTSLFVVMVVPSKILLALCIALMLSRRRRGIQSLFRGAFYLPAVSAGVVMTCVWWWIFNPLYGPLNYLLSLVGVPPIMWLSQPSWARVAVVLVLLNWTVGIGVILYLSALLSIPKSLYEAAQIDGAGPIQSLFRITVPLILPITVFLLVVSTIGIFQVWQAVFLLTSGGPAYSTTTMVFRIFDLGFADFEFGRASAYATMLLLILFPVAFAQFKLLNREVEF